jgi:hypothetical protein
VNRVQRSEWTELFQRAGLKLVEQELVCEDIGEIQLDAQYENLSPQDRQCMTMRVVYCRPR